MALILVRAEFVHLAYDVSRRRINGLVSRALFGERSRFLCFAQWRFSVIKNGGSMAAVHVHILFVLLEEHFA